MKEKNQYREYPHTITRRVGLMLLQRGGEFLVHNTLGSRTVGVAAPLDVLIYSPNFNFKFCTDFVSPINLF